MGGDFRNVRHSRILRFRAPDGASPCANIRPVVLDLEFKVPEPALIPSQWKKNP
jgi:hypothetical protein